MRRQDLQTIPLNLLLERCPTAKVGCKCNDCGRILMAPAGKLLDQLGRRKIDARTPVWDIGRHLKCSKCGSKDVSTDFDLPPFSVIEGFSDGKDR